MSNKLIDLTGQIFGRLTVESYAGNDNQGAACWNCRCLCGTEKVIPGYDLRRGNAKSCGCLQKEFYTLYGLSSHPLYSVWYGMNQRCSNRNDVGYHNYGGRGIAVCDRWHRDNTDGLKNFIEDMESSYRSGLTLDRIDNNGNYTPENCRWATLREQDNNTRKNVLIIFNKETLTLAQWSERVGINENTLWYRIFKYNWSIEKALSTLVKVYKKKLTKEL